MVLYRAYGRISDNTTERPIRRDFSRITGHHNAIDEDPSYTSQIDFSLSPPSYRTALSRPYQLSQPSTLADALEPESLPPYECTVECEGPAAVKYERLNPFDTLESSNWTDIYLKLEGTSLSIYQLGSVGKLSKALGSPKPDWPGRLIKQYSLQQAEAGLASDAPKFELVPSTLAAALWPQSKIRRLQEESPHLFDHIRQYIIRVRVECEQIVLRFKKWEDRAKWIDRICMAIDIATPLEYRTEPKYHTLPRRRRQRQNRATAINSQASMTNLIEEQERIMRERFPHLLNNLNASEEDSAAGENELGDVPEETSADPEADDLDNTMVMVDSNTSMVRPNARASTYNPEMFDSTFFSGYSRVPQATSSTPVPAPGPSTLDPAIKLVPAEIDSAQELRYRRRCMPTLLASSRRCDDIVLSDGKLYKIDWEEKVLRAYPEGPPDYEPPALEPVEADEQSQELQARTLRPSRSSTELNGSTNRSLNSLDNSSSSTARSSKMRGVKGWSKRIRRPGTAGHAEEIVVAEPRGNQIFATRKDSHDEPTSQSFANETLRVLGIQ